MSEEQLRSEVKWFAKEMERVLREHDEDNVYGWTHTDPHRFYVRMIANQAELLTALTKYAPMDAIKSCIDIANYAMMIADSADKFITHYAGIQQSKEEVKEPSTLVNRIKYRNRDTIYTTDVPVDYDRISVSLLHTTTNAVGKLVNLTAIKAESMQTDKIILIANGDVEILEILWGIEPHEMW